MHYVAVRASVNGVGYLTYLVLTWFGLSPRLAVTVVLPVSLLAAFQVHRRVTFGGGGRDRAAGLRFLAVSLTGYALNIALLSVLVDGAGVPHQVAQLFFIGVTALVLFQLMQRVVFSNPTPDAAGPAG